MFCDIIPSLFPPIAGQDKLSFSVAEHSLESEKREIIDHDKLRNEVMKFYPLWYQHHGDSAVSG